jgi:hypothetical protein
MIDDRLVWPYWSVDLPGLDEVNARRLIAWTEHEGACIGGIAVDPALSFSTHLDDGTVEALKEALEFALRSESLPLDQSEIVRGFTDQLSDWLARRPRPAASD